MRICYICHPISGDVEGNLAKIRRIVRGINLSEPDVVPFVPYYADCVSLNDTDPTHRERGIRNDIEFFRRRSFDELWVYGDRISKGMLAEINLADEHGIPVVYMRDLKVVIMGKDKSTLELNSDYLKQDDMLVFDRKRPPGKDNPLILIKSVAAYTEYGAWYNVQVIPNNANQRCLVEGAKYDVL